MPRTAAGSRAARLLPALALAALGLASCGRLLHRDLPARFVGERRTFEARDLAAIAEIDRLHGHDLDLQSAAFGMYGRNTATLWVASARDSVTAMKLVRDMTSGIRGRDSPFRLDSVSAIGGREVYAMSGLGQRHFCFRIGPRIVWVAVNRHRASLALYEALGFYR